MARWTALIKPPVALSCAPRSATGGGYHDLCSGRHQLARRREWRRHIDTRVYKCRALRSSPDGADGIRESAQQRRDAETALRAEIESRGSRRSHSAVIVFACRPRLPTASFSYDSLTLINGPSSEPWGDPNSLSQDGDHHEAWHARKNITRRCRDCPRSVRLNRLVG